MQKIIPISNDIMFTEIFNNPKNIKILEEFLSFYLEVPLEEIKGKIKILSRRIPIEERIERRSEVDLLVDIKGEKINIEMNNYSRAKERNVTLISKIHGKQLKKAEKDYKNIAKTIQINFNNYSNEQRTILSKYYFTNEEGEKLTEKIEIDTINMAIEEGMCYTNYEKKLYRWCQVLNAITLDELKERLGEDLMEEKSREELLEEVEELNAEEYIKDFINIPSKYDFSLGVEKEEAREEGLKEGKEQGLKEGLEQGLQQGEEKKQKEIVLNMLSKGLIEKEINDLTNISVEKIKQIKNEI